MTKKEKCEGDKATEESTKEQVVDEKVETAEAQTGEENVAAEKSPLEQALEAAEDYKRKWYTVSAEYDNYRKRTKEAVVTAFADGKAEAIIKLLPVADTFGYAYDSASDEKTKAGIDKIVKNFNAILLSMGVEEISVNSGDAFDETSMEAVMNIPCEDGESAGVVKYVLKKGYRREGKVIRFAQVSVTV
ncbi:MAG: nucleotide exchange factor GrpE [Candidatus Coproplasma sp.]